MIKILCVTVDEAIKIFPITEEKITIVANVEDSTSNG
jgi:hypothetical protein